MAYFSINGNLYQDVLAEMQAPTKEKRVIKENLKGASVSTPSRSNGPAQQLQLTFPYLDATTLDNLLGTIQGESWETEVDIQHDFAYPCGSYSLLEHSVAPIASGSNVLHTVVLTFAMQEVSPSSITPATPSGEALFASPLNTLLGL